MLLQPLGMGRVFCVKFALMSQDQSDSVETLHISANEAFGKFKGKNLDSDNVDFSDRIRKSKKMG